MTSKNKKITAIVISIIIIIILVIAISYAFFRTELTGKEGIVKIGELELVLNETSEGISLDKAIGLSDSEGMELTPSTFELRNNGNNSVDYTIYLDDNIINDSDTRIDDKYLKYNLVKNNESTGASLLTSTGTNPNRVLDSGTIEGKGTNTYSLNLWITDEVDGNYSGQVFSGKLRVEVSQEKAKEASTVLLNNIPEENLYDDGVDTFITGEDPNNYIWYSGKLWRAVSVNNETKTTKLVTQWNISSIPYDDDSSAFSESYMEDWLNDTSIDGFLGNLRDPEKFIVMDAKWDATMDDRDLENITRPNGTTVVTDAVGLLNMYEYQSSNNGGTNSYLNNGLYWWLLTPYSSSIVWIMDYSGNASNDTTINARGVRPSINLKSSIKIADGDGTKGNPYRLEGDNDTTLSGTLLSNRYSGEYITFGTGENNLYRIVSHENGVGTKITSAEPLKDSGAFKILAFGTDANYSSNNTIGTFLNGEYLTNYVGNNYTNMIEDSTTWYLGAVGDGTSYRLAKYTDITSNVLTSNITQAKVGLLRLGELMAGQFDIYESNTNYWLLTPYNDVTIRDIGNSGDSYFISILWVYGIRPSLNLKSNVVITSGDGTKENPFHLDLIN